MNFTLAHVIAVIEKFAFPIIFSLFQSFQQKMLLKVLAAALCVASVTAQPTIADLVASDPDVSI